MDTFYIDNVKTEKAKAMMRYQRPWKIANLFRFFEICVALVFLSWLSTKLPVTARFFSSYFRDIWVIVGSPIFVFVVGNAIVLILFLKSGQFPQNSTENSSSGTDLYDEFVKKSVNREKIRPAVVLPETDISQITPPAEREIIVYEDKQQILPEKRKDATSKKYQRSQSEYLRREKPKRELRRTKTDKSCRDEDMSNEEFQKKIEEFIAKQVKFLRDESMAIVPQK